MKHKKTHKNTNGVKRGVLQGLETQGFHETLGIRRHSVALGHYCQFYKHVDSDVYMPFFSAVTEPRRMGYWVTYSVLIG